MSARVLLLGALALGPLDKCAILKAMATKDPGTGPTPASTVAPPSFEESTLEEARQLCLKGDCLTAHERMQIALPAGSPARQSPAFRDVEMRWAQAVLAGATNDPDPITRRQ